MLYFAEGELYRRIIYEQRYLCMERIIGLLCRMLIITQLRDKANSGKPVRPLIYHKQYNELSQKDVHYSVRMIAFWLSSSVKHL